MTSFRAVYFDGKRSAKRDVFVQCIGEKLRVSGADIDLLYDLDDTTISNRIGNSTRFISLVDGSKCETRENEKIDHLMKSMGADKGRLLIHALESRTKYVFLALVVTIFAAYLGVRYAVPKVAASVAFSLPQSVVELVGESGLSALDDIAFSPSELGQDQMHKINRLFEGIVTAADSSQKYRLEFRKGNQIGANAFALPSGIIVLTDEMVGLAERDEELIGVLAHEVGHGENRHSLRTVLQDSTVSLILVSMTGDMSSLAAGIPALFLKSNFSREFEREADRYAVMYMTREKVSPQHFARILKRLSGKTPDNLALGYVSTHPPTSERVEVIMESAK